LQMSADPTKTRDELVNNYRETFANPFKAAESGYVDGIVYPEDGDRLRLGFALFSESSDG